MIHYFDFQQPELFIDSITEADYIFVESPTHEELHFIKQYFQLSLAESENDTPHLTIPICKHYENRTTLQLFSPIEVKFDNTLSIEHKTAPLFIMLKDEQVLVLTRHSAPYFHLPILSRSKLQKSHNAKQLFVTIIESITTQYIQHAEKLIQQLETSETILRNSRKNDEFIILSEIEESFLTLKGAIDTNISIIERTRDILDFNTNQISDINDVIEKLSYLRSTFDIHSSLCQNLRDSLATFISNDLNFTMRALAVITILIAIPNLFFGFFGMNVSLPFAQYELAFLIILLFVILFIWITMLLLKRKRLY